VREFFRNHSLWFRTRILAHGPSRLFTRVAAALKGLRPISPNLFGMFFFKLLQERHPERSASQIYRLTQRLMARSRRTPRVLILRMLFGPFRPAKPENRIFRRYALDGHGHIFMHCNHLPSPSLRKIFELGIDRANEVDVRASVVEKLRTA
jgi:hypothetical protein